MRKILTIALVALMATSLFAGVKTSGYVQGSLSSLFSTDSDAYFFYPDSDNKAEVSIADENGAWGTKFFAQNIGFDKKDEFKTSGAWAKNTTWVDVLKLAKIDSNFGLKTTLLLGQKNAALTAYANKADETKYHKLESAYGAGFDVEASYAKIATVKVGVHLFDNYVTKETNTNKASYQVSAKLAPFKGIAVAGGYKVVDFNKDKQAFTINGDVNVGKLADLGFDLGAGAAYRYNKTAADTVAKNLSVEVYGGFKGFSGYGEMTFLDANNLKVGAAYAFTERADAGAYINWGDYKNADFKENVTIGVEGNYKATKNIALYAKLQYAKKSVAATGRCKVTF